MDELEDTSIVLIDTELPTAPSLLREATGKIVLHYSWVNKSLNTGRPLLEPSNWGDCIVTPDNINNAFPYVPPPPSLNPRLQMPRPTPEGCSFELSTPSGFSQGSTGVAPPPSHSPHIPTLSHWPPKPTMLQQWTPQPSLANQVAPCNPQQIQPPSVLFPFSMSQPAGWSTMPYGQPSPWTPFHSGPFGMIQQPTVGDVRRAYEVMMMMMWFQTQQLPPPPPPTEAVPSFYPPPLLVPQNPPSVIGAYPDASRTQAILVSPDVSRQDSTNFNNVPRNLDDPRGGLFPGTPDLPTSSPVQVDPTSSPPPSGDTAGPSTILPSLHTHPKLFEHDVGNPIMFLVPSTLKKRGEIAAILRVNFKPSSTGRRSYRTSFSRSLEVDLRTMWKRRITSSLATGKNSTMMKSGTVLRTVTNLLSNLSSLLTHARRGDLWTLVIIQQSDQRSQERMVGGKPGHGLRRVIGRQREEGEEVQTLNPRLPGKRQDAYDSIRGRRKWSRSGASGPCSKRTQRSPMTLLPSTCTTRCVVLVYVSVCCRFGGSYHAPFRCRITRLTRGRNTVFTTGRQ